MNARAALLPFLFLAPSILAQVDVAQFQAIRLEGFEKSRVMAHLDHLVNRIGPRLTSSDNLTVACEWARDEFAAMGLSGARLEQWGEMEVGFNRGPWWGRITSPIEKELVFGTDAWSAGTKGPARGPVLLSPKTEEELAAMRGKIRGAWVLGVPAALLTKVADAVDAEGGLGIVASTRDHLVQTSGNMRVTWGKLPKTVVVRLRKDLYEEIRAMAEEGKAVEVEFDVQNHFRKGPIPQFNVIADIVGTEKPDEFVVVGGHIDSWDGASGTTDNGTGTATTMEAARILAAIGARPRRTIRFMLWGGEEQGLLGSRAWVQAHKEEMGKYSACLVHDGGTNYVSGIAGMKEMRPQLETAFEHVLKMGGELKFAIREIDAFRPIGSDHEAFTAAGVPGFFWDQAGRADYNHTHHTQFDTYAAAIPEYQMHTAVVVATGALGIANLPEMLTRENMKVEQRFGGRMRGARRMLGVTLGDDGVTIGGVEENSVAAKAGIKVGDKLLQIDDKKVGGQEELRAALAAGGVEKTIVVQRGNEQVTVKAKFER
jgi:carboxypeptidase Q